MTPPRDGTPADKLPDVFSVEKTDGYFMVYIYSPFLELKERLDWESTGTRTKALASGRAGVVGRQFRGRIWRPAYQGRAVLRRGDAGHRGRQGAG